MGILSEDYYYRRCTPDTWKGYLIYGFVLEDQYWGAVRNREGKLMLTVMPICSRLSVPYLTSE